MARLDEHRSFFDRIDGLSVVALAIAYVALTSVSCVEWGQIVAGMVRDVAGCDAPSPEAVRFEEGEMP